MNDATASNIPTNIAALTPAIPSTIQASTASIASPTQGWKTTEFWMTALGQLGLMIAAASGTLPAKYALIAGAVGQAAYSISRGMAKSKATPLTAVAIPAVA